MSNKSLAIRYVAAGMIGVAVLAYILALVLGALPEKAHIDFAAIVLVIVATAGVALLLSPKLNVAFLEALTRVKTVSVASLRVDLEAIQAQQKEQKSELGPLQLLAPLVLTDPERKHLLNLQYRRTTGYRGNHEVRTELRRLRYLTLITNTKPIGSALDGSTFDLAELVQLTSLGAKWAQQLEELEKSQTGDKQPVNEPNFTLQKS
jgi:hypothetical protein